MGNWQLNPAPKPRSPAGFVFDKVEKVFEHGAALLKRRRRRFFCFGLYDSLNERRPEACKIFSLRRQNACRIGSAKYKVRGSTYITYQNEKAFVVPPSGGKSGM